MHVSSTPIHPRMKSVVSAHRRTCVSESQFTITASNLHQRNLNSRMLLDDGLSLCSRAGQTHLSTAGP